METNPRTRPSGEWAPPPPVVVPGPPPLPVAQPPRSTEAEFEATLGGLVEHFAHLPPAAYGEPPELAMAEMRTNHATDVQPARSYLWTAVRLLVLGAVVAGGAVLGLGYYKQRRRSPEVRPPEMVKTAPPAVSAPIKIVVKAPKVQPAVEGERGIPQAEPLPEEHAAPQVAAKPATPKPRASAATPRRVKPVRHAAQATPQPERLGAGHKNASGDDSWEDPYR